MNLNPDVLFLMASLEQRLREERLERNARLNRTLAAGTVVQQGLSFVKRLQRFWSQLWRSEPEVHTTCSVRCETAH